MGGDGHTGVTSGCATASASSGPGKALFHAIGRRRARPRQRRHLGVGTPEGEREPACNDTGIGTPERERGPACDDNSGVVSLKGKRGPACNGTGMATLEGRERPRLRRRSELLPLQAATSRAHRPVLLHPSLISRLTAPIRQELTVAVITPSPCTTIDWRAVPVLPRP